jgi:hypothetical protein
MTQDELNEKASNKAFSKIFHLEEDLKRAKEDLRTGGDGRFSQDLLEKCRDSVDHELQTWNYIAKLIELDNKDDALSMKVLKDLINLNKDNEE